MAETDIRTLKKLLKEAVEAAAPDLRKSMALPRRAKVTAVKAAGGTYVCSVQPVLNGDRPDPKAPVIPEVEIPTLWAGPDRGLVCPPTVGEFCDLGFYDGDPNCPFITNFRPSSAPEAELDSLMLQHSPGIRLGFKPDGTVIIEAPNIEAVATGHIKCTSKTLEAQAAETAAVSAGTKISLNAPLVTISGRVEVTGGIYTKSGRGGQGMEIDGPVRIINGGLEAQNTIKSGQNVTAGSNVAAGGHVTAGSNVTAGGQVIDSGGNTNHHTH